MVFERGEGFEDLARGVLDFVLPKERVFWEPFKAGPLDVRERRVGGIFASLREVCRFVFG